MADTEVLSKEAEDSLDFFDKKQVEQLMEKQSESIKKSMSEIVQEEIKKSLETFKKENEAVRLAALTRGESLNVLSEENINKLVEKKPNIARAIKALENDPTELYQYLHAESNEYKEAMLSKEREESAKALEASPKNSSSLEELKKDPNWEKMKETFPILDKSLTKEQYRKKMKKLTGMSL